MVQIRLQTIKIDTISQSSGLYSGVNIQHGVKAIAKKNEGQGTVTGDKNRVSSNKSVVVELETIKK